MRRLSEAQRTIRRLYRDVDGYTVDELKEQALAEENKTSLLYGELGLAASEHLLDALAPTADSVLWDLGSGLGKLVLMAALRGPWQRAVGVELSPERAARAAEVLSVARAQGLHEITARAKLLKGDFMKKRMAGATHVYACSTAFPEPLMRRLSDKLARLEAGLVFASLQALDDEDPHFSLERELRLDTTWRRRVPVYMYRLTHPRA